MPLSPQKLPSLIVGLGNPGPEFENTYHNVGFLAVDAMGASLTDEPIAWKTHKKIFAYAQINGVVLLKPLTFMNESGVAVREAFKKFNASHESLSVIHDESDLPIGDMKISIGKNSAGHRGVQSIIDHVGTNEFQRARIGIRPIGEGARKKASAFVLTQITKNDGEAFKKVFAEIAKSLTLGPGA